MAHPLSGHRAKKPVTAGSFLRLQKLVAHEEFP